jgi:hypothetical protein
MKYLWWEKMWVRISLLRGRFVHEQQSDLSYARDEKGP